MYLKVAKMGPLRTAKTEFSLHWSSKMSQQKHKICNTNYSENCNKVVAVLSNRENENYGRWFCAKAEEFETKEHCSKYVSN